ncbi:phospholipid scramblase 1-like [Ornithodoros turicata]|uniref:phospholipid scramblase 1-like n=1 Tax=Ornithodoros turicata TaxID=34597 RepID=UPI003139C6A1
MAARQRRSRTQSPGRRIIQPRTGLEGLAQETMVWMRRGPEYQQCEVVQRCFSLASGSFTAYMVNMNGVVAMTFERLLRLQGGAKGCFCCCLGQEMRIEAPLGRQIASISEDWTIVGTSLTMYDGKGIRVLTVTGPIFPPYFQGSSSTVVFEVKTMAGNTVGEIRIAQMTSVSFPINLDVYIKGCLIGCAILVEFMFDMRGWALNCWQFMRGSRRY